MNPEALFGICNSAALLSWIVLIGGPRWTIVTGAIRWGVIAAMSALYALLIAVFFFRVEGGGFFTLDAVQILFTDKHVALAGWVHYLAFDLFVGLWIAAQADRLGVSRLVQATVLIATFMFGPLGFLLFQGIRLALLTPMAARPARAAA